MPKTLSSSLTSGGNSPHRSATPDLRDPLRRHYSLLSPRRSATASGAVTSPGETPAGGARSPTSHRSEGFRTPLRRAHTALAPSLPTSLLDSPLLGASSPVIESERTFTTGIFKSPHRDPRRTRSLASFGAVKKADETQPWRREDWITLARYYEAVGRDIEQTVKVFYRHESLQFEETDNGSHQMIIEIWPRERIRWHARCLDAVTKKHQGKSLLDRIRVFDLKKKRTSSSSSLGSMMDNSSNNTTSRQRRSNSNTSANGSFKTAASLTEDLFNDDTTPNDNNKSSGTDNNKSNLSTTPTPKNSQ